MPPTQRIFASEGQLGVGAPAVDLQLESFKSSLEAKHKGRSEGTSRLPPGCSGVLSPPTRKVGMGIAGDTDACLPQRGGL